MLLRILAATSMAAALTVASASAEDKTAKPHAADTASLIGPEDTLTFVALNCDEISKPWKVGTSGEINLPMIGSVRAAGKTVEQLEQEVAVRLRPYILEPQVNIFISEIRSRPVIVTGAAGTPGVIQLRGPSTLFSVLAMAGGMKQGATSVRLTRSLERGRIPFPGAKDDAEHGFSIVELQTKDLADGQSAGASIAIQPYDVVSVLEEHQPRLVHIMGEVLKPGAVELINESSVSIMKLLAVAGGVTINAGAQNTVIRHIGAEGVQTETATVNLKKIIQGKAKDLDLTAGDIVFVPPSQLKSYLQTASQSALTTGIYILARF